MRELLGARSPSPGRDVLRVFFKQAPCAAAMFDRGMRYLAATQRWCSDFELNPENLIGRSHYEVFPEIPERWKEVHRRCLAGASEHCAEDMFPRADGRVDWLRWEITPWHDEKEKIGGIIIVSGIITPLKQKQLLHVEQPFRAMVETVQDYAILRLDPTGKIVSWNQGAERLKGYRENEIVGRHFSCFYIEEDRKMGRPQRLLEQARTQGRAEDEGWRVRKDGTRFWANVVVTRLRDEAGAVTGFAKITRDMSERRQWEQTLRQHQSALEAANKELEAFSYSVAHDLRAPLRKIDGFSQAVLEDYGERLDEIGKEYLHALRSSSQKMGLLIDELLNMSKVTRAPLRAETIDLSAMAAAVARRLQDNAPERRVDFMIAQGLTAKGDAALLIDVMENLLENAWKFTSRHDRARIEFGRMIKDSEPVYFVRDDGAGFDPAYANKLFAPFQRLHKPSEFPGSGIGLATVSRIIARHGGRIWAEGAVEQGAVFYFTLANKGETHGG